MELQHLLPFLQEPVTGPYSEPDESSPQPNACLFNINFSIVFHLCLGLPSGLFPSGFQTKILHAFLFSPVHATCPTNLTLLCIGTIWPLLDWLDIPVKNNLSEWKKS
jgi:hypothetical protein